MSSGWQTLVNQLNGRDFVVETLVETEVLVVMDAFLEQDLVERILFLIGACSVFGPALDEACAAELTSRELLRSAAPIDQCRNAAQASSSARVCLGVPDSDG